MAPKHEDSARVRWTVVANILSILAVVIGGVVYTNNVVRESEQKWCSVVTTMDDAYASRPANSPPLTGVGQRIADQMHRLRTDFRC